MKLNQLLYGALIAIVFSCGSDNEPGPVEQSETYATLTIISGNEQTGVRAEVLKDSLLMQVAIKDKQLSLNRFYVKATILTGSGSIVSKQSTWWPGMALPNSQGKIGIAWQLGCVEKDQSVRFDLLYVDSCNFITGVPAQCRPIDAVTFSATASVTSATGWTKICGIDWVDSYNTKIRAFGKEIYAANHGRLFRLKQGEVKFWEELSNVPYQVYDFGFDSQGKLYILTRENGIYITTDQSHWAPYGTGILDTRYPVGFLVEDSVVFASFSFDGMYRLRKNSNFARKLLINGKYHEEYEFPVRHPNGDLYLVDKWGVFWKSSNSGNSWSTIPMAGNVISETRDFKIHPSGLLYVGSGDATLAIVSTDTYRGNVHRYYEWNSWSQHIENIQFDGDDVYYLVCSTPNPGIYSSTSNWQKVNLDFENEIRVFHRMEDGNFLLGAPDGVYYKKN